MKNFCTTHRFYYTGVACPFCTQERFTKLSKKYNHDVTKEEEVEEREITNDDLLKLKEKFGCK